MSLDERARSAAQDAQGQASTRIDTSQMRWDLERTARSRRRWRAALATTAVTLVVAAAVLATSLVRDTRAEQPAEPPPIPHYTGNGELTVVTDQGVQLIDPVSTQGTMAPAFGGLLGWSPDGQRTALDSGRALMVGEVAIAAEHQVPGESSSFGRLEWSADGRTFSMVDGDLPARVARAHGLGAPLRATWSPDGAQVAFTSASRAAGGPIDLYVVDADESGFRQLPARVSSADVGVSAVAWSPDGTHLAYLEAGPKTKGHGPVAMSVLTIEPSGAQRTDLGIAGEAHEPNQAGPAITWSPDSQQLAFIGYDVKPGESWALHVMLMDGSICVYSTHPIASTALAWRPVAH